MFEDKASGKDLDRPPPEAMIGFVRDGDTMLVHSISRRRSHQRACLPRDLPYAASSTGRTEAIAWRSLSSAGL